MVYKDNRRKVITYMCVFICFAVIIEMNILSYSNKLQVAKTSQILLDQVEDIVAKNEMNKQQIFDELKLEFIGRAKTVAYILDCDEQAYSDINKLNKISKMMDIDELNLFDENGVIYGGTIPSYYGLSFESGDQMAYFLPMLSDKTLTMCQDVSPNSAVKKNMMYAITWNESGQYMVQVGVEPVRLMEQLKKSSIPDMMSKMPVYEGNIIYVADMETGEIVGATDQSLVGKTVYETDVLDETDDLQNIEAKSIHLNGYRNYCHFRQHGNYIIAVVHSTRSNIESFFLAIFIELVWLSLAGTVIVYIVLKLSRANQRIENQMSILSSVSDIYFSIHMIEMSGYKVEKIEGNELMDKIVSEGKNAQDMLQTIIRATIEKQFMDATLKFANLDTLADRLKGRKFVSMDALDKNVGWLRITFIPVERDENNIPVRVIVATQAINEDKKREEELSIKANRDELTGLLNRRAYEDDIANNQELTEADNFVYVAIDINGLKGVNDALGHAAGDEIIKGAADCLSQTFGRIGRVYRTGGDEFVSMLVVDEEQLLDIMAQLEEMTLHWRGEIVPELSVSVGYAKRKEYPKDKVVNIAKVADRRMYQVKSEYYSKRGADRRGQAAAHTALCNLYTKILKINLSDDTYSIVDMDDAEQTEEKGFAKSVSEWFRGFGASGQVHPDDLEEYLKKTDLEYLKDYFSHDKTTISIFYRRKYEDGYKQVVTEMIPADDYSSENQSLFVYVKTIDK